jgi:hypothetical protein
MAVVQHPPTVAVRRDDGPGFDFTVARVTDSEGRQLAVRVPCGGRFSSDVKDPHVDGGHC